MIADVTADRVTLPVSGVAAQVPEQKSPIAPPWQRWNDYGIACFLEGGPEGKSGGELGQAERAFQRLLAPEFKELAHQKMTEINRAVAEYKSLRGWQ